MKAATCTRTGIPGTSSTTRNTGTAAIPSHSMNAPGAIASAANSNKATTAQVDTSQRMASASARRQRGRRRAARGLLVQRFLRQLGDAAKRTDHPGRFHRHQHELLVRALGQRLERLDVFLRDEVI